MAQMIAGKNAKAFHPDRTMPAYDDLDLTAEQKKKIDTYRKLKSIRDHEAQFKVKK